MGGSIFRFCYRIGSLLQRVKGFLFYRPFFRKFGKRSLIRRAILITNPQFIEIGDRVSIRDGARLEILQDRASRVPLLRIGNDTTIEQNVHIVCHSRIEIGKEVSIAGQCCIVDVTHPYGNVSDPRKMAARIKDEDSFVEIGDSSFLGFGAVVLPNVRIGQKCVIGALSVVCDDVPDYSVAAGSPARVIKQYDAKVQEWVAVGGPSR